MKLYWLLAGILCSMLARAANTADTIPFRLTAEGHILVKASIDSVEGNFILDTGGGLELAFKSLKEKLQPSSTGNIFTGHRATGEALNLELYENHSLSIGKTALPVTPFAALDMDFGGIDGLISMQGFRNQLFTIDYINHLIILEPDAFPTDAYPAIDIQLHDYAGRALDIFTYVTLNNKQRIQVMLDSGAGQNSFWLNSSLMEKLGLDKSTFTATPMKNNFKPEQQNNMYSGQIGQIRTTDGLCQKEMPKVTFVDGLIYEGKTSIEWLGSKLTFDLANKKIYIRK